MTQLRTQLIAINQYMWCDAPDGSQPWVSIDPYSEGGYLRVEFDHTTGQETGTSQGLVTNNVASFSDGDTFNIVTGIYTFANGQPNRFQTPTLDVQPTISNLTSEATVKTTTGAIEFLSKLTSVVGASDQIDVDTSVPGQVTLSLSPNLSFQALTVLGAITCGSLSALGDSDVEGNFSATGNIDAGGSLTGASVAASGDVSCATVTASGDVSGATGSFTDQVDADHLTLKVYAEGQSPDAPPSGKGLLFLTQRS